MSQSELGRLIVGLGAVVVVVGLLLWSGGLACFGRLPGDTRIERETVRVYVPVVSMLLVSVVLSVLFGLARRLF